MTFQDENVVALTVRLRREKEAMPLRSGAFSMVREDNPIAGNTAFRTGTRSKSESDSRG
jgi:hypothetical protein